MNENYLRISENEKLYLDGVELKNVERYELSHTAGNTAVLAVKLEVIVDQSAFEQEKQSKEEGGRHGQAREYCEEPRCSKHDSFSSGA